MKQYTLKLIILFVVVVGILLAITLGVSRGKTTTSNISDLERLSQITLNDYDGNIQTLQEFGDKILIVNSWAVWCPFCRNELPDFALLQKEFSNEIKVIAIDRAESLEKVRNFTDEIGISNDIVFLLDKKDNFYKNIGGFSMPETVFIDNNGTIVFHKRGPLTLEEMKIQVKKILKLNLINYGL